MLFKKLYIIQAILITSTRDIKEIIKASLDKLVRHNDLSLLKHYGMEDVIKTIKANRALQPSLASFAMCSEKTLNECMSIYKSCEFDEDQILSVFSDLDDYQERTNILIDNLEDRLTPELRGKLENVNKYVSIRLKEENRTPSVLNEEPISPTNAHYFIKKYANVGIIAIIRSKIILT